MLYKIGFRIYDRGMWIKIFTAACAVLAVAFVIVVTIAPIQWRPRTITTPFTDRMLAFVVASFAVVSSFPDHLVVTGLLSTLAAATSELLQKLSHTRHARLTDAFAKALGALIGALLACLFERYLFFRI